MCSEIHWHWQQTPWSAQNLLCISDLHADISKYMLMIRRKRRYSSPHATWRRHGRASWWSPCLTRMYVLSLPLLNSGNSMLYLCHYRRVGAYRVGRTRRPYFLLLPPTKEEVHVFARVRLSVCLSVSKITQKRAHGFGWNVACRQMWGHGRTD